MPVPVVPVVTERPPSAPRRAGELLRNSAIAIFAVFLAGVLVHRCVAPLPPSVVAWGTQLGLVGAMLVPVAEVLRHAGAARFRVAPTPRTVSVLVAIGLMLYTFEPRLGDGVLGTLVGWVAGASMVAMGPGIVLAALWDSSRPPARRQPRVRRGLWAIAFAVASIALLFGYQGNHARPPIVWAPLFFAGVAIGFGGLWALWRAPDPDA